MQQFELSLLCMYVCNSTLATDNTCSVFRVTLATHAVWQSSP